MKTSLPNFPPIHAEIKKEKKLKELSESSTVDHRVSAR